MEVWRRILPLIAEIILYSENETSLHTDMYIWNIWKGMLSGKKLTKREKQLREQLFQKAVDRQIWRGKGDF